MNLFTRINTGMFFTLLLAGSLNAQWCTPTVTPYASTMPGISNVTFNTINHNSPTLENSNSNYVNTGLSTTVTRGNSYSFSMTFNIDASICPDMNLRVWIDFNQDGQLDDPGEDVVSVNNQLPGTYTATITIPSGATLGTTRMRVTSKMTSNGGHTLPTPCNIPADPLGYHGGVEDYTVVITGSNGVNELDAISLLQLAPNPANGNCTLTFNSTENTVLDAGVFSITGELVLNVSSNASFTPGKHELFIDLHALTPGVYFVKLSSASGAVTKKLVVL